MVPLRMAALFSNVLFVVYGAVGQLYPVLILHSVLLPVNAYKLFTILRLRNSLRQAGSSEIAMEKLVPLMTERRLAAGHVLFRAGDVADRMYYVAEGTLLISEIRKTIGPGAVLGEIGIFAADRKRMATLICQTDCQVFELGAKKAKELYFQDPSFAYGILRLIITRLLENRNDPNVVARPGEPEGAAVPLSDRPS